MRTIVLALMSEVTTNLQGALSGVSAKAGELITSQLLGIFGTLSTVLGLLVIPTWILTLVADERAVKQRGARLFPEAIRADVAALFRIADRVASTYLRVRVLLAVATGLFVYAGISIANQLGIGDGRYAVAAAVLLGALQLIPELGFLLGFVALLIPLAIGGPEAAIAFALIYIGSVKAASTLLEGRLSRGVLDVHPGVLIPGIVVLSQFGAIWLFAAAPIMAIVRDLVRYANARLADPPGAAGVLPGEKVRSARTSNRAGNPVPSVYRAPAPPAPAARPASASASSPTAALAAMSAATVAAVASTVSGGPRSPAGPPARVARPVLGPGPRPGRLCRRPAQDRGPPAQRQPEEHPAVTDDPARMTDMSSESAPTDGSSVLAQAYIQLTEAEATPLDAADALERRDQYGRVPIVVRVRRQPPINPIWILLAIGLAASGLFLPLAAALRAMIIVAAVVAVIVGIISRLFIRVPPGSVGLVVKSGRHDRVLTSGNRRVSPIVALSHLVTTREIAFDVPVSEVRSADGVGVAVDVLLTLRIADPVKFAYAITPGDADQFVQAACQDAVRTLVRGIEAMSTLDLNSTQSDSLRQVIDPRLDAYGIDVSNVAFTRVTLPFGTHRLARGASAGVAPARRAGRDLAPRQASPRRPGRTRLPGGPIAAICRGVRGRGRGPPAGDARGADRGQPERRALRPGGLPDPRRRAARRQQPGRGVAGGDGPHVQPADGARGRGRERRCRCSRCGGMAAKTTGAEVRPA